VIAVGQFREGNATAFAVIAYALDGIEEWRRIFRGTADFGSNSAAALAIHEGKGAAFIAGVITDDPTGPDMFAVGLSIDGSDLPSFPGKAAKRVAHRSTWVRQGPADTGP
jgi:hypothetical protein